MSVTRKLTAAVGLQAVIGLLDVMVAEPDLLTENQKVSLLKAEKEISLVGMELTKPTNETIN